MNRPLLEVKNLNAWYDKKKTVLSGLSLNLFRQEAVGLIGLNGAGKTTFLKILSGLATSYQADSLALEGCPVRLRDRAFKESRYTVFAEDNSFAYFTFREYLSYVSGAYGRQLSDVPQLVQGFHFEQFTDVLFKNLSQGHRRKAFLITAFALKPKLLMLDEPVNGLDFEGTEYLYRQIAGYKEHGTVLFASHILESITETADRVLVLEHGKISRTFEQGQVNAAHIREALCYE